MQQNQLSVVSKFVYNLSSFDPLHTWGKIFKFVVIFWPYKNPNLKPQSPRSSPKYDSSHFLNLFLNRQWLVVPKPRRRRRDYDAMRSLQLMAGSPVWHLQCHSHKRWPWIHTHHAKLQDIVVNIPVASLSIYRDTQYIYIYRHTYMCICIYIFIFIHTHTYFFGRVGRGKTIKNHIFFLGGECKLSCPCIHLHIYK